MILNVEQRKAVLKMVSQALSKIRNEAMAETADLAKIRDLADAYLDVPNQVMGDFPAEEFANGLLHVDRDLAQHARKTLELPLLKG